MKLKGPKLLKYLITLLLAAVLVYFAFRKVDWSAFVQGLACTRWGWVALFAAASVIALVFRIWRWRAMLMPLDPSVRWLDAWDSNNVGNTANIVIPGAGEFVRCGYISSRTLGYDKAFGTIICERMWDFLAVGILFVVALALKWEQFGGFFLENIWQPLSGRLSFSLWWVVGGLALVLAAFVWAVYHWRDRNGFCSRIAGIAGGLWSGFASFARMDRKWLFAAYTLGIWASYVVMSYCILKAVPSLSGLGFMDAVFLSAVGNVASVIPVPGGIGAYHYLIALSLQSLYGVVWDTGILYATLQHELHAIIIIILGVVSYLRLTVRKKKDETDNSRELH